MTMILLAQMHPMHHIPVAFPIQAVPFRFPFLLDYIVPNLYILAPNRATTHYVRLTSHFYITALLILLFSPSKNRPSLPPQVLQHTP
jgi:hypothetical protein